MQGIKYVPGVMKRDMRPQAGTILLETLVGIAVVSTTVLAGIVALSTASLASEKVSEDTQGAVIAISQIESIRTQPYLATGNSYPSISTPAGSTVTNTTSSYPGGGPRIQNVTVQVTFDGDVIREQTITKIDR